MFASNRLIAQDPSLVYCSYMGGSDTDDLSGMVIDEEGNIYLCGITESLDLPTTSGAHQENFAGGAGVYDGYIMKLNPDYEVVWCTYFGGQGDDYLNGMQYQGGKIYICGSTSSSTGIATEQSFDNAMGGTSDGFLACFDSDGFLQWSTYFGGSQDEEIIELDFGANGDIVCIGSSSSSDEVATIGAYEENLDGIQNSFLARFNSAGLLMWSTYFGGNYAETGKCIATDADNNIYISGTTLSEADLISGDGFQPNFQGLVDSFLAAFSGEGQLLWSTYFGGESADQPWALSISSGNTLLLLGATYSEENIVFDSNSFQPSFSGGFDPDGFLAEFSLSGDFLYSTYLGGTSYDYYWDIYCDENGYYLTAQTGSAGLATSDALHNELLGYNDAIVTSFSNAHELIYSTYLGAQNVASGQELEFVGNKLVLAGETSSNPNFTTPNAEEPDYLGQGDCFVAAFDGLVGVPPQTTAKAFVYPNPTTDQIQINTESEIKSFAVFDIMGQMIMENSNVNAMTAVCSLASIDNGIYQILVKCENSYFCAEVIVSK